MSIRSILLPLTRRLHTRHKFAALGVAGMLMVITPWVEVLRDQAREVEAVLAARAALDPVRDAVSVQRGLLAHRPLAAEVLRGRQDAEAGRMARQREVDHHLAVLADTLQRGRFEPAFAEGTAMREDWGALVAGVTTRSLTAAGSDAAHRLMVEQVLQVIDLVARAGDLSHVARLAGARAGTLRSLPALEATIAGVESARQADHREALEFTLAAASRALRQVERQPVNGPHETQAKAAEHARAKAQLALTAYLEQVRQAPAVANASFTDAQASLRAWTDLEHARLGAALDSQAATSSARRRGTAMLAAACALIWLGLLALAWPAASRRRQHSSPALAPPAAKGSESREPTDSLLRRLREGEPDTESPPLR